MSTLRILSRSASTAASVGASPLRPRLLSCLYNSPAGAAPLPVHGSPLSTLVGGATPASSSFFSSSRSFGEEKHPKVWTAIMTGSTAVATRGFSSTSGNPLANIDYRIASPAQHEEVVKLLYGSFFTDEPMSRILQLTDGVKRDPVLDEFVFAGLNENLTIVANDSVTGKLLGACINVIAVKSEKEETLEDYVEKYKDSPFRHIMHVLYNVNHDAGDIYTELGSNVLFDIKMITTDKHNRKGGLATDLLARSFELAKCLGFKGVKTEATGLYSRKAFTRIGFDVKAECVYEDFVSMDGDKIFAAAKEPHRCTSLMTKKI